MPSSQEESDEEGSQGDEEVFDDDEEEGNDSDWEEGEESEDEENFEDNEDGEDNDDDEANDDFVDDVDNPVVNTPPPSEPALFNEDNSDNRTAPTLETEDGDDDEDVDSNDNPGQGTLLVDDGDDSNTPANTNTTVITSTNNNGDDTEGGFQDEVPLLPQGSTEGGEAAAEDQSKNEATDPIIKPLIIFIAVASLIAIILFPILFLVVLPNGNEDSNNDNSSNGNEGNVPAPGTTISPTMAPTTAVALLPFANVSSLSSELQAAIVNVDRTTTTAQAYDWLVADPELSTYTDERKRQRFALAGLYYAAGGTGWTNDNWMSYDTTECDWNGIKCTLSASTINENGSNIFDPAASRRQGGLRRQLQATAWEQVTALKLPASNLVGQIPPEFALLTLLSAVDLMDNKLKGTIPSEVGLLQGMVTFDVSNNQFSGELTPELGDLDNLRTLSLQRNAFKGPLPDNFALLDGIKAIDISFNQLTGPLPAGIGALTLLSSLHLQHNQISSTIPMNMGLMRDLESLLLQSNNLQGTIPADWEQLYTLFKLSELDISLNPLLLGEIPELLCNMSDVSFTCVPDPVVPSLCGCDCPCFNGTDLGSNFTLVNVTDTGMGDSNVTVVSGASSGMDVAANISDAGSVDPNATARM